MASQSCFIKSSGAAMASSSTSYRLHLLGSNLALPWIGSVFLNMSLSFFLHSLKGALLTNLLTPNDIFKSMGSSWTTCQDLTHKILGLRRLFRGRLWCCKRFIYRVDRPRENSGLGPANPEQQKCVYAGESGIWGEVLLIKHFLNFQNKLPTST